MAKGKVTTNQLADKFDGLEGKVDRLTSEIQEFMGFVKDNVAMKADLENYATKNDLHRVEDKVDGVRTEVLAISDQVTRLQLTVEHELIAPTFRMDRMEGRLHVVETKLGLAT